MNLYLRLLITLCLAPRRQALHHRAVCEKRFRVWPHDIDLFGHMNNGRYLQIMDVARTDWMLRTGVATLMWRNRWSGVLGGGFTRYRHALKPLTSYRVRTRLLYWDQRWFYFEHRFIDGQDRPAAVGLSRAALRGGDAWIDSEQVVAAIAPGAAPPSPPPYLDAWQQLDSELFTPAADDIVLVEAHAATKPAGVAS